MAEAAAVSKVKLICGMISADRGLFDEAAGALSPVFGQVDVTSEVMDFDFTHYYDREMGSPLYRRFVSFADLMPPDAIIEIKLLANALECDFASRRAALGPPRPINIDPGYVEPAKLVLVSMKDFSHRIYLGKGVYGEITLMYRKGDWEALPWTFPDYASGRYNSFLTAARGQLRRQLGQEERR